MLSKTFFLFLIHKSLNIGKKMNMKDQYFLRASVVMLLLAGKEFFRMCFKIDCTTTQRSRHPEFQWPGTESEWLS